MVDMSDTKPKTGFRWMRLLLFVSLAINLLIVGVVAGAVWRGGPGHSGTRGDVPSIYTMNYGPFGRALSPKDRRDLGRLVAERKPFLQENRRDIRTQYIALIEALRTEPFDPEIIDKILSEQRVSLLARQDVDKDVLLRRLAEMTVEERATYTKRLERFLRRGDKRK